MKKLLRALLLTAVSIGCMVIAGILCNDPQRNGWTIFLALVLLFCSICIGIASQSSYKGIQNSDIFIAERDDLYDLPSDDLDMLSPFSRLHSNEVSSMYNQEHRRQLYQGANSWNTWRKVQKIERPQLADIEFSSYRDLSKCDLHG